MHFRRLFNLTDNKSITVRNMFLLGWEEGRSVEVDEEIVGVGGVKEIII